MGIKNSLVIVSSLLCLLGLLIQGCSNKSTYPSSDLTLSDLAGTWVAQYSPDEIDTIAIDVDGTFTQFYEDTKSGYIYKSEKDLAYLAILNGFQLHFPGGRYYLEGIELAESDGTVILNAPLGERHIPFYDPFTDTIVKMVDELILVIRMKPDGTLILHHIWTSSDRGFLLFNGDNEIFFRK